MKYGATQCTSRSALRTNGASTPSARLVLTRTEQTRREQNSWYLAPPPSCSDRRHSSLGVEARRPNQSRRLRTPLHSQPRPSTGVRAIPNERSDTRGSAQYRWRDASHRGFRPQDDALADGSSRFQGPNGVRCKLQGQLEGSSPVSLALQPLLRPAVAFPVSHFRRMTAIGIPEISGSVKRVSQSRSPMSPPPPPSNSLRSPANG